MAIGSWAKKKAKQATKAVGKRYGVSYGRRGVRAGKNSLSKLAKDVMMIKASLNTEKKYVDTLIASDTNVGQVRDNTDGSARLAITPSIPQGTGEGQRIGNSIKATGMVLKLNMLKQPQAEGDRRVRFYLVRTTDPGISSTEVHQALLDPNPFVPVRDYNSNLDYTQFKDGRLKVIATKNVYFPQNGGDGLGTISSETMTRSVTIAVKMNEVLRYASDGNSAPENVRYFLIGVCDNGNAGTTTSSILGCACPQSNSGIDFQIHQRLWYVDN